MTADSDYDARAFWEGIHRCHPPEALTGVGHGGYGPRYNAWLYRAKERAFRAALARGGIGLAGRSVLDVGCGTGVFRALARGGGCRSYTGLDISPLAVERLAAAHPEDAFHVADVSRPLDPAVTALGGHDLVLCFDVIYHVVSRERLAVALANLWSFVRPGGHLLLVDAFWTRDLVPGGRNAARPGWVPHVRFHRLADYRPLLERGDLERVGLVGMYYLYNRPIEGRGFPWSWPRLSWHLRWRLFEWEPLLALMYRADGWLLPRLRRHPGLKILVARKRAAS